MVHVGIDYTILFQIVQFLVIVLIVNFLIVKPIRTTMVIRERKTDLLKDRTKASHAAIEQKSQEYDEKFKATLKEISAYQNQLRSDAQARTQAMFDKVKSENSAELANSKKQIAEEANVARNNLKAEISGIMGQIVQMVTK